MKKEEGREGFELEVLYQRKNERKRMFLYHSIFQLLHLLKRPRTSLSGRIEELC